jgi:hypothetical protein
MDTWVLKSVVAPQLRLNTTARCAPPGAGTSRTMLLSHPMSSADKAMPAAATPLKVLNTTIATLAERPIWSPYASDARAQPRAHPNFS